MMTQHWITVLAVMVVGSVVLGPGGAVGAGFLCREWIITEKRHKGALTVERVREMEGSSGVNGSNGKEVQKANGE